MHGIDTPLFLNDYSKNKSQCLFTLFLVDVDLLFDLLDKVVGAQDGN